MAPARVCGALRYVRSAAVLVLISGAPVGCDPVALPTQGAAPRIPQLDTLSTPGDSGSIGTGVDMPDISAASAQSAELPRLSVTTTYPAVARQVRVAAGGDLQAAINAAQPGDELLLAPGASYVGNFLLPNKGASSGWIVIRTDVPDASIGAAGTRMTPTRAAGANLAKILTPNLSSVISTSLGASRYRFTGVEISATATAVDINALVRFGEASAAQNTVASIANNLIIDRSYVHGSPTLEVRRCVALNSATSAVIDSWLGDCHSNVSDSQAIVGWNGPGPFLIQNNYLEGGHEVIVFGGGGTSIANQSPSDVTIRGNHITRPLAWKGVWQVKNLLETKHVRRMLVEGNVFENNWADAQAGFAFVLKSENQNNDSPWTQSTDITIRYNRIRNTGNGFNLAANPSGIPAVPAARIVITDNIMENVNTGAFTGDGHTLQLLGGLADIVMMHNTVVSAGGGGAATTILGSLPTTQRLVIHSNVLMHGTYGIKGGGTTAGTVSLTTYAPGYLVTNNLMVGGGLPSHYPPGNVFSRSLAEVGFDDILSGNYRLTFSIHRLRGLNGTVLGADVDAVDVATQAAVVER